MKVVAQAAFISLALGANANAQVIDFNAADDETKDQIILQGAGHWTDTKYFRESIALQNQTGMNEFDYNRFLKEMNAKIDYIDTGATMWTEKDMGVRFSYPAALVKFDFERNVYQICVADAFRVKNGFQTTGFGYGRQPEVRLAFAPTYSTSGFQSESAFGVNCNSVTNGAIKDATGGWAAQQNMIEVPMSSDQAEALQKASSSLAGNGGIVNLDLTCNIWAPSMGVYIGMNRAASVDCNVVSGKITAGSQSVGMSNPMNYYQFLGAQADGSLISLEEGGWVVFDALPGGCISWNADGDAEKEKNVLWKYQGYNSSSSKEEYAVASKSGTIQLKFKSLSRGETWGSYTCQ